MTGLPAGARVVVAMSGGVDSSATAALLKEQGLDVVGVTLQLYDQAWRPGLSCRANTCCGGKDIADARAVAEALAIPHYVLDFEAVFKAEVMDALAETYVQGRTPVPCIACNETVKFRDLVAVARDLGASALATGHYVRRHPGVAGAELWRGLDPVRDQSYFLFSIPRPTLDFLLFPLGDMAGKDETRAIAARHHLPVAAKQDSQDICFVPDGDYAGLVEALRPGMARPGAIVDTSGIVLGAHKGLIHYTIGQRKGLGLGGGPPLYVLALEPETNHVVVGPRTALDRTHIRLSGVNWLGPEGEREGEAEARVRSTRPPVGARFRLLEGGAAEVVLSRPEQGVAPGQACVLYRGARVLGGGWIESAGGV